MEINIQIIVNDLQILPDLYLRSRVLNAKLTDLTV